MVDEKVILTPEAIAFVQGLHHRFGQRRRRILEMREERQRRYDAGELPNFMDSTKWIREESWQVAPVPHDLQKRHVEITGPAGTRKMVRYALNSGADGYMADAEDSESPTWKNIVNGQANLYDAVRRTLTVEKDGKVQGLDERPATLMFRPRGWHMYESHCRIKDDIAPTASGFAVSASLFDFGMYFFHNVHELLKRGTGVYLYLPKMESYTEAKLWSDIFTFAEDECNVPRGTIRATVLIETLPAAFEMDEILYSLREHITGLNCGRWDYIFSYIKKLMKHKEYVLPDRAQVTMDKGFLKAYATLLIQTCHKRGAYAMGGMAPHTPIKDDPEADERARQQVRADKTREVEIGHDGGWVAHPGQVGLAKEVMATIGGENQLHVVPDAAITAEDLLRPIVGMITEEGIRDNIRVNIQYVAAWLSGTGCVALNHKMEDAATCEIARAQIRQWIEHDARLADGRVVTRKLVERFMREEEAALKKEVGHIGYSRGHYGLAESLLRDSLFDECFPDFLTLEAYPLLLPREI